MIVGVGVDIVGNARLKSAVERWGAKFLRRVFTENEISYAYKRTNPFQPLAARFAAKEAFIKAVRGRASVHMTDIEVSHDSSGAPLIIAHGDLKAFLSHHDITHTHVSLSHERDYSIATVVLEK